MDSKNNELNRLFDEWKSSRPEYKGFKKDGIIDETKFDLSPRILFICKEPNDKSLMEGDYREDWIAGLNYTFSRRIGEWAHGILNDFPRPDFGDVETHKALKSIAFMNVKKTGGGSRANHVEILNSIKRDMNFLHREISIIDPRIIICSLGLSEITKSLFPEMFWIETGYNVLFAFKEDRVWVDFYHPSIPAPGSMSYTLLERVFGIIREADEQGVLKKTLDPFSCGQRK